MFIKYPVSSKINIFIAELNSVLNFIFLFFFILSPFYTGIISIAWILRSAPDVSLIRLKYNMSE